MNSKKRNLIPIVFLMSIVTSVILVAFVIQPGDIIATNNNNVTAVNKDEFPYEIGESYAFKNLQLFFLSTDNNIIDKEYISLSEAMEKKFVTVFETESVNQLAVENQSEKFVFICSGEIVKGGKQDRTLAKDIILPPKSGKIPLASFCVESGRWQQREGETLEEFSSSNYSLSSRDLKVAAKKSKSQGEVWNNVSRQQVKVNENMVAFYDYDASFDVKSETSETSLQLTLENEELRKVKAEYETFFKNLSFDKSRTVGFVYAINGEIYGIDIYHNYKLFNDLWSKMLDAILVEAIAEKNKNEIENIDRTQILSLIKQFSEAETTVEKEEINSETTYIITSSPNIVKFETLDKREDSMLLHLNYISVDTSNTSSKSQGILEQENIHIQRNSRIE